MPPRYWWLKRILLAVGVLILALAGLRWWWGYEAERHLQAKIDQYQAAGQPVTIEDFQFPAVPHEHNAAQFLIQAASGIAVDPNSTLSLSDVLSNEELMETQASVVRRLIALNDQPLRQARQARTKQQVDWGIRFTRPIVNITGTVLPYLSPQRELARLLCVAAFWQHRNGDDGVAVETLRDAIAQAERVGQIGVILAHLTALAIDGLALDTIESVASHLLVADALATPPTASSPARREQVQALIADLLDEETLRENWRWAMYGERLYALDCVNVAVSSPGGLGALSGGPAPPRPFGWLLKPMFQLDAVFMMEYCTAYAEAGTAPDCPTAQALTARYPAFRSGIERVAHVLSSLLLPALDLMVEVHFRAIAMRRLAATALAIRLYEIDHGRRPASLDQLIPDYLPAIPLDPFAADGRALGYLPRAPKPVLYSVGPDGIDDGTEYEVDQSGAVDWEAKDLVFFLNGDRPRAPFQPLATQPTATQAVENEAEQVGDGGQPDQDQAADEQ